MKTELYNCHRIDDRHYKITKFDEDLNPMVSAQKNAEPRVCSYVVSTDTCDCPAGEAKSCRHRKMLNIFISNKKVDTEYFFNYELHDWYRAPGIVFLQYVTEVVKDDKGITVTLSDIPPVTDEGPLMDKVLKELEGGAKAPASEAPSPQPSRAYRRF